LAGSVNVRALKGVEATLVR
jgi:hypothetical protein